MVSPYPTQRSAPRLSVVARLRIVFAAGTYRELELERNLLDQHVYELTLESFSTPAAIASATADAVAVVVATPANAILPAPNAVLTPYVEWYSRSSERRMRERVAQAVRKHLEVIDNPGAPLWATSRQPDAFHDARFEPKSLEPREDCVL
jgi:hypothetical protein